MKTKQLSQLFVIATFFLFTNTTFAQLGINSDNSVPSTNAMLDVKSTTKGILIPRVGTDLASPSEGLLYYNTANHNFRFYDGTAWQQTFFGNQWNVNGTAISYSGGNVGIGIAAPTQKLDVAGNLKVSGAIMPAGQAGIAGQVLTSAGTSAAPIWANTAYTGNGRFWIIPANNTRSTGSSTGRGGWNLDGAANETTQTDSLDYGTVNETGSDFTISNPGLTNNFITVNKTGLYHFEGVLRYFVTCNLSVTMLPRITLDFLANQPTGADLTLILLEDPMDKTGGSETSSGANNFNYTAKFAINIHLVANSKVTFRTGFNLLRFPGAVDLIAMGVSQGGYISGHLVSE